MNSQERQALIAKYKEGYNEVTRSLEGFPPDLLTAHPIEGKWSAAEIVHHLADSETTSGLRLRKLLVEDRPLIPRELPIARSWLLAPPGVSSKSPRGPQPFLAP